ncbi:MAG TPA: helix-turn-helix domain-containing protein [Candidatus Didemnitutus sp.]|nr:helix-turn-helix domain-containing protein [Candidatus Didemnitutus sp.]
MQDINSIVRKGLDERLSVLQGAKAAAVRPARGWLRAVRQAIGARQEAIAKRMAVQRQSYARLETSEAKGAISLNSLQKAAEAMDCDVVYYLVPRAIVAKNYAELAQKHDPKFKHLQASEHSMALEDQAVGDLKPKR